MPESENNSQDLPKTHPDSSSPDAKPPRPPYMPEMPEKPQEKLDSEATTRANPVIEDDLIAADALTQEIFVLPGTNTMSIQTSEEPVLIDNDDLDEIAHKSPNEYRSTYLRSPRISSVSEYEKERRSIRIDREPYQHSKLALEIVDYANGENSDDGTKPTFSQVVTYVAKKFGMKTYQNDKNIEDTVLRGFDLTRAMKSNKEYSEEDISASADALGIMLNNEQIKRYIRNKYKRS